MIRSESFIRGMQRALTGGGGRLFAVACWAGLLPLVAAAQDPAATAAVGPLQFMRVHVPQGGIADVPLGNERYVPMSVREFEAAVAHLSGASAGQPARPSPANRLPPVLPLLATAARYAAVVAADGSLSGNLAFDIGAVEGLRDTAAGDNRMDTAAGDIFPGDMPLGSLVVARVEARTAAGTGAGLVFGRSDGSFAIAAAQPGTYACDWKAPAPVQTAAGLRFSLPLIPALHSTVTLILPEGRRPIVLAAEARPEVAVGVDGADAAAAGQAGRNAWRIDVGPLATLDFLVVDGDPPLPPLSVWSDLLIRGQQVLLGVTVQPAAAWTGDVLELKQDSSIAVVRVAVPQSEAAVAGSAPQMWRELAWSQSQDRRSLTITLPATAAGTMVPVLIEAVAPLPAPPSPEAAAAAQPTAAAQPLPLPLIRVPKRRWSGGGMVLRVDPTLSLTDIAFERCLAVTPEVAARWPLLATGGADFGGTAEPAGIDGAVLPGIRPPRVHVEQQAADPVLRVAVAPRTAEWEVARVTTIDLSPGVVLGRAACEIRVLRGEAFELTGRIAPGWIVDAVEAVEWTPPNDWQTPRRRTAPIVGEPLDWKVVREKDRSTLRIGLTVAATPARSLGLRITGHRAGTALGAAFSSAEIDMVCLDGEAAGLAVIAFKTNVDTTVEVDGGQLIADALEPRLASLVEEGGTRAWAAAGTPAPSWEARLVRRRPPLDVLAQVRLTARDDRLTESFTFECRPDTSELDAVVVQFSEPMDGLLEWSLLPPATSTLTARRFEPAAAGRRPGEGAVAAVESWMIEIAPPVREPVTIRAVRTLPFTAALPVPLAWVEGAVRHVGQVVIRDAGRSRSQVVNRLLGELPPRADEADQSSGVIAEFSFPSSPAAIAPRETVAELIPGGATAADEARAWAWSESTTCWCHSSGWTEYETLLDIENHGRSVLTLSLPAGRRLQGILLDGVRVASDNPADAAAITIELPTGRRRLQALVRTVMETAPGIGAWRIDPAAGGLDLPVLERTWRVMLPPELEIATATAAFRAVGFASPDWTERLLGARLQQPRVPLVSGPRADATAVDVPTGIPTGLRSNVSKSIEQGFRERTFLPAGGSGSGGMLVIRTRLLAGAAILTGLVVALVTLVASRGRPWLTVVACVIAALAALWVVSPYESIARAAWWATLVSAWLRSRWNRDTALAVLAGGLLLMLPPEARGQTGAEPPGEPLRVFMTPVDKGETALVPEPLFRLLVRGGEERSAAVRILASRVEASPTTDAALPALWRLAIDVDADAGGMLVLDQQASGGRWIAASALLDGRPVAARAIAGDRVLRLLMPAAGRQRIEIDVEPAVTRVGDVEIAAISIPIAPAATLEVRAAAANAPVESAEMPYCCECGPADGPYAAALRLAPDGDERTRYDISRSAAVRLVRAVDPRATIATSVRLAESRNDVFWDLDACRVNLVCEIDSGEEILRSVVVAADPRLACVETPDPDFVVRSLEGNRFLIERRSPVRGPVRIEIPLRMPHVDPVGKVDLPQAWLEGVAVDKRTTRLVPSPSLVVQVALPDGVVALPLRDTDSALQTHAWFTEAVDGGPQVRTWLTAERRRQDVPATQSLTVRFTPTQTRLELQARIDASSTALVAVPLELPPGCVIDRLNLFEESVQPLDPVERGAIDLRWSQLAPDRLTAMVQRPRAGRFRLELVAHLPRAPARAGRLPLLRALLDDTVPLAISWNTAPGTAVLNRSAQRFADEPAPDYALDEPGEFAGIPGGRPDEPRDAGAVAEAVDDPAPATGSTAAAPAPATRDQQGPRVELADVQLNVEDRGRAWGLARFDIVTNDPVVRLQLPQGMRLFDAFVDGHALVPGVPSLSEQANVWELRLHDVRWPRSLLVVFAGDLGGRLAEGAPLEVQPPLIVGLPCTRLLWTLRTPRGMPLRVAEPAIVVGADALASERAAAMRRLTGDFERSLAAADGPEQERLRDFLRLRDEQASAPPAPGRDGVAPGEFVPAAYVVMQQTDSQLTIRAARQRDSTVPSRAVTTLATIALGGAALRIARRRPQDWLRVGGWFFPCVAGILGVAWLFALAPAWPGGVLLAYAFGSAARAWLLRSQLNVGLGSGNASAAVPVLASDATVTHMVAGDAPRRESSITQIAPFPGAAAESSPPVSP